jgi:NAD(P)-dependent dehydrogenase (short-subunit alcohol dehydrogenase family)
VRDFAGRVAVVTGAASGIGLGLVERFASGGMKVVLADVEQGRLDAAMARLQTRGCEAVGLLVDVSDPASVERLAALAYERFGAVHVLCNNAGVMPSGRFRPVWEYPLEDWRWVLDVNLMGVVHGLRSFIPRMLAAGEPGHIVNTSSVAGVTSGAYSAVYGAAKHGVVRITEALYASLEDMKSPIGVTVLCPGVVRTQIYQSERNRPENLVPAGGIASEPPAIEARASKIHPNGLSPDKVADMVVGAIRDERLYLLTTEAFDDAIRDRLECILARRNPAFPDVLALSQKDNDTRH